MLRKSLLVNFIEFKEEILLNVLNIFLEVRSRGESFLYVLLFIIILVVELDKGFI